MVIFIIGNVLCARAYNYGLLMVARVVTALFHGAFFGIGALVADGLVPPYRRSSAVVLMFTALTLANVLRVPRRHLAGVIFGWRETFWCVSLLSSAPLLALLLSLPAQRNDVQFGAGDGALRNGRMLLSLLITVFSAAAMLTLFSYIAPLLLQVTHISDRGVSWTLFLIGTGLTVGNLLGERLADWRVSVALMLNFALIALFSVLFRWTSGTLWKVEITLFSWAMATILYRTGATVQYRSPQRPQCWPLESNRCRGVSACLYRRH